MAALKFIKDFGKGVVDTMKTEKKHTVSRRRMKKAEKTTHSAWTGGTTTGGKNRVDGGMDMFSEKGGTYKDVRELNRHMEKNDKYVDKNVNAYKVLKSVRDKVKKKKMSKTDAKNRQAHTRELDIVKPTRRSLTVEYPPGGAESKAHRGFKKGVKKEFKRSEREDRLSDLKKTIDSKESPSLPTLHPESVKRKPSMFIKREKQ
tara:strand:- start:650 stop:1258 length:609 start_codon:yes stop_codon:yes gene_type:complete